MLLRLCGPAALFVVVLMAARIVPGAGWYAVIAWPVLLPAWVLLAVALPFDRARTMSQRSALRPARKRRRAAIAMAAIAVNVAGTTAGLFVWR